MLVNDFLEMFTDTFEVAIYDYTLEKETFRGWSDEVPEEYEWVEVDAIDPPFIDGGKPILCINVEGPDVDTFFEEEE